MTQRFGEGVEELNCSIGKAPRCARSAAEAEQLIALRIKATHQMNQRHLRGVRLLIKHRLTKKRVPTQRRTCRR